MENESEEYIPLQKRITSIRTAWVITPKGKLADRLERRWAMTCSRAFFRTLDPKIRKLALWLSPVEKMRNDTLLAFYPPLIDEQVFI